MDQNKLLRSIVRIHAYGRPVDITKPFLLADRTKGVGTGAFVHPPTPDDNYVYMLTCSHCVDIADSITVMLPFMGLTEHSARVVCIVPLYDLALLALSDPDGAFRREIHILPLGSSSTLTLGQNLKALGYPLGGTSLKASDGVYAGFQERLQHTVSISPGNSGGPLMNEAGDIVGINNSGIVSVEASNVGFAVPIECYTIMKDRMFAPSPHGTPSPERVIHVPMFGFEYSPISRSHATSVGAIKCGKSSGGGGGGGGGSGVQIITVLKGSAADQAEIVSGDLLMEFEGVPIDAIGEISVPWNYQKVRLRDVLVRCTASQSYTLRLWKTSSQTCETVNVSPTVFLPGPLRTLYPPYDTVPYLIALGLVIMPLVANHRTYPSTISSYMLKRPDDLVNPCLIVTHVFNGTISQIEGPIVAGDELSHVNGVKVSSMEDATTALCKLVKTSTDARVVTFRTCTGKMLLVNVSDAYNNEIKAQEEKVYVPNEAFVSCLRSCR